MLGLENGGNFRFAKKNDTPRPPSTLKSRDRNSRQSGKLIVLGVVHFFSRQFVTSVSAILVSPPLRPGLHLEAPTLGDRNRNIRGSGKLEVVGLGGSRFFSGEGCSSGQEGKPAVRRNLSLAPEDTRGQKEATPGVNVRQSCAWPMSICPGSGPSLGLFRHQRTALLRLAHSDLRRRKTRVAKKRRHLGSTYGNPALGS